MTNRQKARKLRNQVERLEKFLEASRKWQQRLETRVSGVIERLKEVAGAIDSEEPPKKKKKAKRKG